MDPITPPRPTVTVAPNAPERSDAPSTPFRPTVIVVPNAPERSEAPNTPLVRSSVPICPGAPCKARHQISLTRRNPAFRSLRFRLEEAGMLP
jgi:hypothetical protein